MPAPLSEEGLFEQARKWQKEIEKLPEETEFSSFLVGVVLPWLMEKDMKEEEIRELKGKIKREVGTALQNKWKLPPDFKLPDVTITLDFFRGKWTASARPLCVYGRYLKFDREIPQARWLCRECHGKQGGCGHCGGKGKMYATSIQELIGEPLREAAGAKETAIHALGREDIDARMLGNGRPFILALAEPKKRKLQLADLEAEINKSISSQAEVRGLCIASESSIPLIKAAEADKRYQLKVEFEKEISDEEIEKMNNLVPLLLQQQTPERVKHRRADLERKKEIKEMKAERITAKSIQLTLLAQSGTYIKEFITGDNGRTKPSISELIGKKAIPSELDVIELLWELHEP